MERFSLIPPDFQRANIQKARSSYQRLLINRIRVPSSRRYQRFHGSVSSEATKSTRRLNLECSPADLELLLFRRHVGQLVPAPGSAAVFDPVGYAQVIHRL